MPCNMTPISIVLKNWIVNAEGVRGSNPLVPPIGNVGEIPVFSQRTHTVASTASGGGSGTALLPWTLEEAMQNAQAGDIIGVESGVYVGSDPTNGNSSAARYTPAFSPTNSGTESEPIWFVTENLASENTTNLTTVLSGATTSENGWPAIGSLSKDYIRFNGFNLSELVSNGKSAQDSAPYVAWTGTGCEFHNYKINGESHTGDNHSGIRIENTIGFKESGGYISGFNGHVNASGIIVYYSRDFDLGRGTIENVEHCVQLKSGNPSSINISDLNIHHKVLRNATHAFRFHGPVLGDNGEYSKIYNNIVYDVDYIAEFTSSDGHVGEQDGLRIFNNTFFNIASGDPAALALSFDYTLDGTVPRNNIFFNNIIHTAGAYWGKYASGIDLSHFAEFMQSNRNVLFGINQMFNGSTGTTIDTSTLSDYQALSRDVDSITADPLFTNTNNKDFTLQAGSPALTLGRDTLNQFGGGVDAVIPSGAYVTGSEQIGVVDSLDFRAAIMLSLGIDVNPQPTGATYYLDNTHVSASDSNDGLSAESPWLTLGKAITTLTAGEMVWATGTYTHPADITPTNSGTSGNPIIYRATTPRGFKVDQQNNFDGFRLDTNSINYTVFDGLEIKNTYGSDGGGGVFTKNDNVGIHVFNCYIHDVNCQTGGNTGGVRFDSQTNGVAYNNVIHTIRVGGVNNDNGAGVHGYGQDGVIIAFNKIYDAQVGISAKNSRTVNNWKVLGNHINTPLGYAIYVNVIGSGNSDVAMLGSEIYNNIFEGGDIYYKCYEHSPQSTDTIFRNNVMLDKGVVLYGITDAQLYDNIFGFAGSGFYVDNAIITERKDDNGIARLTSITYSDHNNFLSSPTFTTNRYANDGGSEVTSMNLASWQAQVVGDGFNTIQFDNPDSNSTVLDPELDANFISQNPSLAASGRYGDRVGLEHQAGPDWEVQPSSLITSFLGGIDFDGLTSGQSVTSLVDIYGTYGNGYGMQGDTTTKRAGKSSSVNMSIQSGTTGRPGDGTPAGNGDFGFIQRLDDRGHAVVEGEELWLAMWIYVPADFSFDTNNNGLKFIRFTYPNAGPELDTYIAEASEFGGAVGDNGGWHLVNESFPQFPEDTHRETQSVLVKGQWNFVCKYTKASINQEDSIERLWINDVFTYEHLGGVSTVTTTWLDETGTIQSDSWTPATGNGGKWSTLDVAQEISTFYLFTYWNGNAPKDQSLNIQEVVYHKNSTGLAVDNRGNSYISSGQV